MADKAHRQTDKQLEQMERHLSAIYSQAGKEIEETAKKYFEKFAELDEQKKKQLADGKITEKEYKTWRQNKILYGKRYTKLKDQISEQLAHTNKTALAYVNGQLPPVYAINYNATGKGIEDKVKGYSFELTDANAVKNLATAKKIMLPEKKLDIPADKLWNAKKVNSEVLQGILQGDSMDKIANRMQRVTDMNATSAIRNARTMVTSAENSGRLDGMRQAEEDGIEIKKEWIATTDGRTRHWHAELDGVQVGIDEPFENEFGKIMFPGDPSADGANVYNCRCTLASVVVWFGEQVIKQADDFVIDTREAAIAALEGDIGFDLVEDLSKINTDLLISNTKQLEKLEKKFGVIHDSTGSFSAVSRRNTVAYVSSNRRNPLQQNLVLCPSQYKNKNKFIEMERHSVENFWSMPCALTEEELSVYSVTHEYGHMLQNKVIAGEMAKMKSRDQVVMECFDEIKGIALEKNPDFKITKENISRYGASSRSEFFAEVFANSQLSKPNELGEAMNEWLNRRGLIK